MIVPFSLVLAMLPSWWPDGFSLLTQLPVLGWFRAPARYTLFTSLGLGLLAGGGLDCTVASARFSKGLIVAIVVGAIAWSWSIYWANGAHFQAGMLGETLWIRFGAAGLT
jgi:hypothetical protein